MPRATRTPPERWIEECLRTVASTGEAGVSVERLAATLGVTKGSFYHHFADRSDLLQRSLEHWQRLATDVVIEELEQVDDPAERLRAVLAVAFGDDEWGTIDVMLAVSADPTVLAVASAVAERRIAFMADAYRQLGVPDPDAERRAAIAYSTYLGHFHVAAARPDLTADADYFDLLVATLLP
ncbi:TetR/AcrR family transcriptional regulator [Ilumatobacter coccineus]|jgi:AcrR family transcriptional regulator|uniref:Putative TetR family transcriptional regulator n=1 Tax=Ilumatobacter coccineus (strain NBRC 103263 / KCTC 29153 / YM16-304) TaxID=1313172 RepID=A0A6C7E9E1_ILUCY|nr:TetR/AcrR family transcriptional regulator [Ilumatobacter coccineus]BAN04264.1 putative TetR family transcriptional regulator [Ilumatobacter coccineus YM16-304]